LLYRTFPDAQVNYLFLAFPLVGIILTMLFVTRIVKDQLSHGVSIALRSMCNNSGKLKKHNMYSSMIASTITVAFGGSVGLEAPLVLTAAATGSNLAQLFKLSAKNTRLLLACGVTAAIAAIFKAPIAGIVFAIEILMLDLTATAILPLLISAATGTVLSILFLGDNVMFNIYHTTDFQVINTPFYIGLGALAGLISVFFLRTLRMIEKNFGKIKYKWGKAITGGLLLGAVIFVFPILYGEGYESINKLFHGGGLNIFIHSPLAGLLDYKVFFWIFLAILILVKVFAAGFTTAAGGIGGMFAPSFFVGAFLGFFVAQGLNTLFGLHLPVINFVLAGMAGVMTGVMHAPLTSIFLIAEVSTGYTLLIPLMCTSSLAYLTVKKFEPYSIYTKPLADAGDLLTHNKDKFAIQSIDWKILIDTNISTISIHATLRDYTHLIALSKRNLFVVLDNQQRFAGLLVMDEHRDILFQPELYDSVLVKDLMIEPVDFIYDTDNGEDIIRKFQETNNFNMPVITGNRKYIGFLSKAKVLTAYKEFIAEESDD
jgi:CIC family chloride channel protein